ncbi:MAG: hypothetical protein IJV37_05445 [Bacteroidales bacterium]|nr:hypothetical protein [Bacteroidales bacterium]
MKKSEIKPALDALKEIKINKFEDKDVRNTLIDDHFALLDAGKKLDAKIEDMRKVFIESYKDEEQAVQDLQTKINETTVREEQIELSKQLRTEHKDYLDAVKDFNDQVTKLYSEEVEVKKIDREKLMDELKKQDLKLSWVEALYPLFNL